MRPFYTLLLFSLTVLSCKKSDTISPETLTGTWIEVSARQDTLIFNLDHVGASLPASLTVKRGTERNSSGYLLPKIGSGIYIYELQGERIFVRNLLSSSSLGADYAIEQQGDRLMVENFFELGFRQSPTATRTFTRVHR
ncbi:hypothetical protein G8759_19435 [Spirosoma aureum]|uniref:Lipocalin-like domain-containing protein n=2 Tax=Spirosoma aureum TaxID=2692134 RepID=A0A6G9AZY0_9BACT|nr:hypothetical protein G8759_19435 [Spirosoma aureum]